MTEYRWATNEDYQRLIEMANRAFHPEQHTEDFAKDTSPESFFPRILPKLYQNIKIAPMHYLAVQEGKILCEIPLPVAGLLSEERRELLEPLFSRFLQAVETIGLAHQDPMSFLTLMALAVSPALKVTDLGLLDTAAGEFVDLIV